MNLYREFAQQASRKATITAIVEARSDKHWSFAEIDNASANMANRLFAEGLRRGDAVLLLVPMSVQLYVTLLACFRQGLAVVIIDPAAGREHIERCCRLYPPKAFIGTAKAHLLRLVVPALRDIPLQFTTSRFVPAATLLPLDTDTGSSDEIATVNPTDTALISFTSGSTGQPKIALRSHEFLLEQHRVISRNQPPSGGTSSLTLFPVFVLSNLARGDTSILADVDLRNPQKIDAGKLIETIHAYCPHNLGLQPVVLDRLTEYCRVNGQKILGDFTVCSGGAPVFPALLKRFARIAPGARLVSVYGSTEAEPIALAEYSCNGAEQQVDPVAGLLAGRPVDGIKLQIMRIVDDDPVYEMDSSAFAVRCLGPGEIGEIVVSGKHVLNSYLNGEGDAENKYRVNGEIWHRTGDAGSLDQQGRLWLAGRCSARIEDQRGNRYPLGIEAAAMEIAEVKRAALVRHRNKRLLAIECLGTHRATVRASLAKVGFDEIRFIDQIPVDRRHNGKIDYARLSDLLN